MKKLISIMLVLVLAFSFAACAGSDDAANTPEADNQTATEPVTGDLDYVKGKGNLIIGYTVYEPMNYTDGNGEFVGFDTEYAKAVCEKLGVTPEFVEINWGTKEIELNAKNIDCIWNGFTISEERKQNVEFTQPYINNKQVVVIKADNAQTYTDAASLSSAYIVAEIESAGEKAIAADENLSQATYVAVSKQTDGLLEVKAGTADAVVLDYTLASAMVGEGTDYADLMIIEGLDLAVEEYGIGFRKGSDIAAEVDKITDELTADGTMDEIAAKYDMSAILVK